MSEALAAGGQTAEQRLVALGAERGRHTRMIYTNPEMPLDCACLIVFWAEV